MKPEDLPVQTEELDEDSIPEDTLEAMASITQQLFQPPPEPEQNTPDRKPPKTEPEPTDD